MPSINSFSPQSAETTKDPLTGALFHITHWKAGSQWIMKILRDLAPDRIVNPRVGEGQFLLDALVPGGVYPTVYVTHEQFRSVAHPAGSRHFVILRDLRDTLVSAYFSFRYSHGLISLELADVNKRLRELSVEDGLLFLAEKWLPGAASIHASWLASAEPVIWYEDLLSRDIELLEHVLVARGGLQVDAHDLRRAVQANRFEVLTRGRLAGQEDNQAHERKGIADDWKNHFTSRVDKRFRELYGALVPPAASVAVSSAARSSPSRLSADEVLRSYDLFAARNPTMPPYNLWLAWEHAAIGRFPVAGRVIDLGCSDPGFFRLCCPQGDESIGMVTSPVFHEWAQQSGVYREVHLLPSFEHLPVDPSVDHVFTRTLLNQIDRLEPVLKEIWRCLRPGGALTCTVLTQRYDDWSLLPRLFEIAGHPKVAASIRREHKAHHDIVHALPADQWREIFVDAGFEVGGETPILPRFTANLFLLFDTLWHRPDRDGELGDQINAYIAPRPELAAPIRKIIAAVLEMEPASDDSAGLVFHLIKPAQRP